MKKLIVIFALALMPLTGMAAGGNVHLESANIDLADNASLQRGAKYFVNYCMGCHAAQYFRYENMQQFDLTIDEIKENMMFAGGKPGDLMTNAMPAMDAANWFGAPAPDLTLVGRIRGADWIYTYLKSFYADDSRPMGVNNSVFPNVGMPHVLAELQGVQKATLSADGKVESLQMDQPGKLSAAEYDEVARDIANFMVHIAEPVKLERQRLGVWVIGFLLILFVLAYLLKKEYWKDIH